MSHFYLAQPVPARTQSLGVPSYYGTKNEMEKHSLREEIHTYCQMAQQIHR